jgi:hypothetical protein
LTETRQFGSIYNRYLYRLFYLFNSPFMIVFGPEGYGVGTIKIGLALLGICLNISIGPPTDALFLEPYFQWQLRRTNHKNAPVARVMMGKVAGITFSLLVCKFPRARDPIQQRCSSCTVSDIAFSSFSRSTYS